MNLFWPLRQGWIELNLITIFITVIESYKPLFAAKKSEIFRPYVSHKSGGTGLGLSTARRLIEEHGGRLEVKSEEGRGSDFVVTLPSRGVN